MSHPEHLRALPSVDTAVRAIGDVALPRVVVVDVVRRTLDAERQRVRDDGVADAEGVAAAAIAAVRAAVAAAARQRPRTVINATGVVLHTNLGRAPLAAAAIDAITAAAGYTNLELDLTTGDRGGRGAHAEQLLATLAGAEAAAVVNNCAAALVIVLKSLVTAERPEIIVSRGELVQIGGGFRVPEILETAGAVLREVGTTNRTTADDFRRVTGGRTAGLLRVHRGNFYQGGFTEDPVSKELAAVASEAGAAFVEDLGTGNAANLNVLLDAPDTNRTGAAEPTIAATVAAGADLVCFSGDKLLGGPQAGIIVGRASRVAAVKRHPLFRALRCDKLVLAALAATVELHLRGDIGDLPFVKLLRVPAGELLRRAERIVAALGGHGVVANAVSSESCVGGGTLPRLTLPSAAVELRGGDELAARLRRGSLPVVGTVAGGRVRLDLRAIFAEQDDAVIEAVMAAQIAPGIAQINAEVSER